MVRPVAVRTRELSSRVARVDGPKVTWSVQFGLGGLHEFSVKFINPGPEPATADLSVNAADGTRMGSHRVIMLPGITGESGFGADMNAGDYTVTLTILSGAPRIESLLVK